MFTDTGVIRGSVLPLMASGHAFNTAVDTMPISWDHIELRLDAYCATRADCESLGINVGDFVAFDPLPEFTESGHISARHLDDKAGVAALLAALKAIVDSGAEPLIDCHPLFTITEETGSGAAGSLPWDVSEFVGIDIAPVAPGQHSSEHAVSVAMQDSGGPYDYHLSRHLLRLGQEKELSVRLLTAYIMSPPVFASDAKPANASLENFSHQIEHDAQMETDTRVPAVDTLVGQR